MKKLINLISEEVTKAFVSAGYDEKYGKVTLSNRPDLCEFQCKLLPDSSRQKAAGIRTQCEKLRTLIDDLNLTSKLEYGAQPLRRKDLRAGPLFRQLVAQFCESPLAERCEITLEHKMVVDTWSNFQYANELQGYRDAAGKDIRMVMVPNTDDATASSTFLKPSMFWCVAADSDVKDAAVRFINYFTNDTSCYDIVGIERAIPISSIRIKEDA